MSNETLFLDTANLFFRISEMEIDGAPIRDHFVFENSSFWWSAFEGFVIKAMRNKNPSFRLDSPLYQWNELFAYNDPRCNRRPSEEKADIILFNTSLGRSKRTEGSQVLSYYFKNLEPKLKEKGINYVEISYMNTKKYCEVAPYAEFDFKITAPLIAYLDSDIRSKELQEKIKCEKEFALIKARLYEQIKVLCRNGQWDSNVVMNGLESTLKRGYPGAVRAYLTFKKIIKLKKAHGIFLLGHEDRYDQAAVAAAKKMGIKALEIVHGILPDIPCYPVQFPLPHIICVEGNTELERWNRDGGIDRQGLRATGAPRYDMINETSNCDMADAKKHYGVPRDKKVLLFLAQTHDPVMIRSGESTKIANCICQASKSAGYQLVIKLHPDEDQSGSTYRTAAVRNMLPIVILNGHADLDEAIYLADAVCTKCSTAGIDAVLLGKPLILLEFMKSWNLTYFSRQGFKVVQTVDELSDYLEALKDEHGEARDEFMKNRKRFMTETIANFGHASEAVVNEIAVIVGKQSGTLQEQRAK